MRCGCIAGLAAVAMLVSSAVAAPRYRITEIGSLGGNFTDAQAINNYGETAGYSTFRSGLWHAFRWNGTTHDLNTLGGLYSVAIEMNDTGQVVGHAFTTNNQNHAFIWESEGSMRDLGTISGNQSQAHGINNKGQIVGWSSTSSGGRAALWQDGSVVGLGTLGGASEAYSINEAGQVVGKSMDSISGRERATLWQNEAVKNLGTLPGTIDSVALDINNSGIVVGVAISAGIRQAFRWDSVSGIVELPLLPGIGQGEATSINDAGDIVGYAGGSGSTAVIWTDGKAYDLDDLVPNDFGHDLASATGINNLGQIIARADQKSFLLTPVPDGDSDFDGKITSADYFRIDRGRAMRLTGYENGDFDDSGGIANGDDYMLIDRAFLTQFNSPAAPAAPVPEPTAVAALALIAAFSLQRSAKRRKLV
jgi:probable HAF family extracellular repeat protein